LSGIELKCTRIRYRVLQYELAAALGIPQTELSQYENEKKPLPIELEKRITGEINRLAKNHLSEF
jgi:hypothetical protein